MLVSAAILFIGGGVAVSLSSLPLVSYLGVILPAGILVFFGYRAVSAGRERKALGDERTSELYGRVGINSFWMLMIVINMDMVFQVFPQDIDSVIYVFSGLIFYGAYFGYYRYIE